MALRRGDLATFLAGGDAHDAACRAASALAPETLSSAERGTLARLVQANAELVEAITEWRADARTRMSTLQSARRTTGAYGQRAPESERWARSG